MSDPILFNPDNRLLGSAIGDLGMYGGQNNERFSVHEARDDAAASLAGAPPAEAAPGSIPATTNDLPLALDVDDTPALQPDSGAGTVAPTAFMIAPTTADFAPVQYIASNPVVAPVQPVAAPAETGSGSLAPVLDASAPEGAVTAAHVEPLSDGPLMGPAADLLDNLAAEPILGGVTGVVDDVLAPVAGLIGGALTGVAGLVDDTLEGLAGSDPLAGVETLVNLVAGSDTFDLTPVVAPLLETVSDTGQGLVDALIGEESITDSLLGDHHEDGLLGGLIHPDHPLGL